MGGTGGSCEKVQQQQLLAGHHLELEAGVAFTVDVGFSAEAMEMIQVK